MTVKSTSIPHQAEPVIAHFAQFLAESEELRKDIDTSVEIEVRVSNKENSSDYNQDVRVEEIGNDGYELIQQRDDNGEIRGYNSTGTSKVGKYVQDLADEFFGTHNYRCGFYEDEHCSETVITP